MLVIEKPILDCTVAGVQIPAFSPTQEQSSLLVSLILLEVCSEFVPQVAV